MLRRIYVLLLNAILTQYTERNIFKELEFPVQSEKIRFSKNDEVFPSFHSVNIVNKTCKKKNRF